MPPKKAVPRAGEGSTSADPPARKPTAKATAPKLKPKKAIPKSSTADNAAAVEQTTKTPAKKAKKKDATAKPAASSASKAKTPRPGRPALPGETPPTKKELKKAASAKATSSAKTPQQRANTSKKRTLSALEEDEDEDEEEPVATKSATKKIRTEPSKPAKKRKATAEPSQRPKKVAKVEEEEEEEQAVDPVDGFNPRLKKTASHPAPASSKARTPKPSASKAASAAGSTGRGRPPKASKAQADKKSPASKVKKEKKAPVAKGKKTQDAKLQLGFQINFAPIQPLDIFIFGAGESGELGLGNQKIDGKRPVNVKRPRLHPLLSAEAVGVVQVACGGMHSVALTKDNKILTWGVNDQGALGRNTEWDGGLRDADAEDEDDEDGFKALNPLECTPAEVSARLIANGTKFVKVVASDSASFALTEDGRLYGWGTFRSSDGILGFSKDVLVQTEPKLLPESKNIVDVAAGNNHVMTLDSKGKVETWGAPEMNQLGRRVVQRDMKASALRPGGVLFKRGVKIVKIACGSYHSFAIDDLGRLYAWGLNNYGELGLDENVGEDSAAVLEPTLIQSLEDYGIAQVAGGEHHSVACTEDGKLLVWGRIDGKQTGLTADKFNSDNAIHDEHDKPRILTVPTVHEGFPYVESVACGTDNSFAITQDGKAYSWGFSAGYQTGQGEQDDDVEVPTLIDNTAVHGRKILSAGAGGHFSVLTSVHQNA